jgi:hypothetical protein
MGYVHFLGKIKLLGRKFYLMALYPPKNPILTAVELNRDLSI